MKKLLFLLVISLLMGNIFVQAQESEHLNQTHKGVELKLGVIFNPQVYSELKHFADFKAKAPIYMVMSFHVPGNKLIITPAFEISKGSIAVFIERELIPWQGISIYSALEGNFNESEVCLSFGVMKIYHEGIVLFYEVGSVMDDFNPTVTAGVSLPLLFKIK